MAKTYKEKLLDPRWQKMRLKILERDSFTCQYCSDKDKTLHVHHFCYNVNHNPWDVDHTALITICEDCHKVEHLNTLSPLEKKLVDFMQLNGQCFSGHIPLIAQMIKDINKIILTKDYNG